MHPPVPLCISGPQNPHSISHPCTRHITPHRYSNSKEMGRAHVRCKGGCTCNSTVVDGYHEEKVGAGHDSACMLHSSVLPCLLHLP